VASGGRQGRILRSNTSLIQTIRGGANGTSRAVRSCMRHRRTEDSMNQASMKPTGAARRVAYNTGRKTTASPCPLLQRVDMDLGAASSRGHVGPCDRPDAGWTLQRRISRAENSWRICVAAARNADARKRAKNSNSKGRTVARTASASSNREEIWPGCFSEPRRPPGRIERFASRTDASLPFISG